MSKNGAMPKIDKNVSITEKTWNRRRGQIALYPWEEMNVGDSFLFPKHVGVYGYNISKAASYRLMPKRFIAKSTNEGLRCWRIA